MTPHTVTIYNKYDNGKYKQTVINNCKFVAKDGVKLGSVQVQGSSFGKVFVYEKDMNMEDYKEPLAFKGEGFTLSKESIVVIGEGPEITRISELGDYEHYTVQSVVHQNYSMIIEHHFSLEVK